MGAWWLGLAALAAATPETGSEAVDAFIADLAAGRRDAALARIHEMNSLSGRPNAVALADEFVDKLLGCAYVSSQPRNFGGEMYDLRWRCPDGDYHAILDPNWRPPRLVVGEFVSAADREARRRNPAVPPPPVLPAIPAPELSAEARAAIAVRYLGALRQGTAPPSLAASVTTQISISGDRVAGGLVWIGPLPAVPTIFSPH